MNSQIRGPKPKDTVQLAIETTGRTGSIAVLSGQTVLTQAVLDAGVRTAAALAPQLEHILRWCEKHDRKLGFISVADGPGSFTGLRIGVTTAKTLGYALSLPVVGVDSLAAIAAAVMADHPSVQELLVGLGAYRGQVYSGRYQRGNLLGSIDDAEALRAWTCHPDQTTVDEAETWAQRLAGLSASTALAGDRQPFGELASKLLPRRCDAIGVGLLGIRAAVMGHCGDPFELVPRYLKQSAAEEKASAC
ncbi:MAG: tRNA (adenosine(37)-N6)-threonylcarbamoyltransferase complex dimerization subunit type 1 TsaB [Pirellulales bacterium]|nr:tRNA (adenosine(37)-N6)-threonylcarbamoyltransferase complex dimerization subunit type 1 TsaB [Pirellulales bacterium]